MGRNALISICFIIIILVLLSPFIDGIFVQKKVTTFLHRLNSQQIKNRIIDYHRGWFTSKVTVLLSLPQEKLTSKWTITIEHGPWFNAHYNPTSGIFGFALFHLVISPEKMKFAQFLARKKVGYINVAWHFNDVLTGVFQGFKLNYQKNHRDVVIHSTATSANFQYRLESQQLSLHAIIGGLNAQWQHHNKLRILPALFSMQGKIDGRMVLFGDMQLHIPLIMWQGRGRENLSLQNFNLISEHSLNAIHRINYLNKVTVELLSYQHRSYAPGQWLSTGQNLTENAIDQQRILLAKWWQAILTKKALFQPSQWYGLQKRLVAYYQRILADGGYVQQHASLNTSLGNLQIDFHVKHPKRTEKIHLQLHWQIAKPLAKLWLYYAYHNVSFKTLSSMLAAEISTDKLLNRYQALGLLQKRGMIISDNLSIDCLTFIKCMRQGIAIDVFKFAPQRNTLC